ncbi:MAG: hypothetical protein ABIH92_02940, partial [Nanoarchaeota archaeon]
MKNKTMWVILGIMVVLAVIGLFSQVYSETPYLGPVSSTPASPSPAPDCRDILTSESCDGCPCSVNDPSPCPAGCIDNGVTSTWYCRATRDCSGEGEDCYD